MKKSVIALAVVSAFASPAFAVGFVNGGFEDGNIGSWAAGGGNASVSSRSGVSNASLNPADWLPGGTHYNAANSNSAIIDNTSAYVDPNLGGLLGSTVFSGRYSYRVENTSNGGYASAISQSVKNYTDSDIFFAWKAVLENGGHSADQSAAMVLTLVDDTTHTTLISRLFNAGAGGSGVDSRFTSQGNLFYTPQWQIEQLSIDAALQGHDFTLSVLAADCQPTGHTGYVYLDGFGARIPDPGVLPEPGTLALAGLALAAAGMSRRRKSA